MYSTVEGAAPTGRRQRAVVSDDKGINFDSLNQVVNRQLAEDAKYDRENDAKFRAVRQKVPTYEDFEAIVQGAHLQPMKDDVAALEMKRSMWDSTTNQSARSRAREQRRTMEKTTIVTKDSKEDIPKTVQKFLRGWRRACKTPKDKYSFVQRIGGERLGALFKYEVPEGLLGPIVEVLSKEFVPQDAAATCEILRCLQETGRFGLAIEFFSDAEKSAAVALFDAMSPPPGSGGKAAAGTAAQVASPTARRIAVESDDEEDSDDEDEGGGTSGTSGTAAAASAGDGAGDGAGSDARPTDVVRLDLGVAALREAYIVD